jgi:bifunctional oligoribonuclease and PAP phosphatase NrnA
MLGKIANAISKSGDIALLPHIAADGDALGSSFALALAISRMGKKVKVLLEEDIPFTYGFLPGIELSGVYQQGDKQYDTVIAVDCGDLGRLGNRADIFEGARITANIDHHPTNTGFAVHNFVDTGSAAAGEIIYKLLGLLKVKVEKDIATCLYVAIATDTGSFRYSNTTSFTHELAAELLKAGVDVAVISQKVFDATSFEKVKLISEAINTLELFENGRIAVMAISNVLIKKSGAKEEECDGIINTARNIRGVEVAAMLRQLDNGEIKVNLRSNLTFDVSAIASLYKGGGHKKAAGYTTAGTLENAKKRLLEDIREVL